MNVVFVLCVHSLLCALSWAASDDTMTQFGKLGPTDSCEDPKKFYHSMGFTQPVPEMAVKARDLSMCKTDYTCCPEKLETKIVEHSVTNFKTNMEKKSEIAANHLAVKYKEFDDFFEKLIKSSKTSLDTLFEDTYKSHYTDNAAIFMRLFDDVEKYYRGAVVDMTDIFDSFFTTLMQQVFKLLKPGYDINEEYMQCIADNMNVIQPFADLPQKLSNQLRIAFIAARTFIQGLETGEQVAKKLAQINPSKACTNALVEMLHCSKCSSNMLKPCFPVCNSVMTGCLCDIDEATDMWNKYLDAMMLLLYRLEGPFNIESMLEPLDVKISEAIMMLQDNGIVIAETVYQMCGEPPRDQNASNPYLFEFGGMPNMKPLGGIGDSKMKPLGGLGDSAGLDFSKIEFSMEGFESENPSNMKPLGALGDFAGTDSPPLDFPEPAGMHDGLGKHGDISKRSVREDLDSEKTHRRNKKSKSHRGKKGKKRRNGPKKKGHAKRKVRTSKKTTRSSKRTGERYKYKTPLLTTRAQTQLKLLVDEMRSSVDVVKDFWRKLPASLCEDEAVGESEEECLSLPEIKSSDSCQTGASITEHKVIVKQQVVILQQITVKLQQAYHGIDTGLSDDDDARQSTKFETTAGYEDISSGEYSGEGSGTEADDKHKGKFPFDMEKTEGRYVEDLESHQIKLIEKILGPVGRRTSLAEIQERLAQHPNTGGLDKPHSPGNRDFQPTDTPTTTGGAGTTESRHLVVVMFMSILLSYFVDVFASV